MGSILNFVKQHKPGVSKVCQLNLEKKNKANSHQKSQPGIKSFFPMKPKVLVPSTIPMPDPVIAYTMESAPQLSGSHIMGITPIPVSSPPNIHAVNILVKLEKAIGSLPVLPDASEFDEIAMFSGTVPTNLAKDEAWEFLDPMLNRFLGFNRTTDSIYNVLRGGASGLSAMVRYLEEFIGQYEIDGALLEGKIQRLMNAIQTQYVTLSRSKDSLFNVYCTCAAAAAQG